MNIDDSLDFAEDQADLRAQLEDERDDRMRAEDDDSAITTETCGTCGDPIGGESAHSPPADATWYHASCGPGTGPTRKADALHALRRLSIAELGEIVSAIPGILVDKARRHAAGLVATDRRNLSRCADKLEYLVRDYPDDKESRGLIAWARGSLRGESR